MPKRYVRHLLCRGGNCFLYLKTITIIQTMFLHDFPHMSMTRQAGGVDSHKCSPATTVQSFDREADIPGIPRAGPMTIAVSSFDSSCYMPLFHY